MESGRLGVGEGRASSLEVGEMGICRASLGVFCLYFIFYMSTGSMLKNKCVIFFRDFLFSKKLSSLIFATRVVGFFLFLF